MEINNLISKQERVVGFVFLFYFFFKKSLDQLFSEAVLPENEIRQLHEYVIFSTKEPNVLILLLSTMTMK